MKLPFGDFEPDKPTSLTTSLSAISNAYPGANGYRPVGAFTVLQTSLPTICKGAASFTSAVGKSIIIAGTATNLYIAKSGGFASIGSSYSIQGDARWRFAQFGGLAIATNGTDPLQKIDVGSEIVAPLGGTPPTFRMLGVVQNFLVGGVYNGNTNVVAWSGENNAEWWTFGQRKSDYNIFPDGGDVTGIIGGEYGLILQRGCIRRMTYIGGNVLFRFDKIASNVGCVTVHSVAQYGDTAFWYSDSGFKMWDGTQIIPIGFEKVDATFAAQYNSSSWPKMSCAIDGPRNTVTWSMGDKIWIYNWLLLKWSIISLATEIVFSGVVKTLSVDEQDILVGVNDGNMDYAGLLSFDDPRFKGGDPRCYLFDTTHALGTLSGANLAVSATAGNYEIVDSGDTRIRRIRPMTDAIAGMTVTISTRQRFGDSPITSTGTLLTQRGEMPIRARGRFALVTLQIAAGQPWTFMQGIALPTGKFARGNKR